MPAAASFGARALDRVQQPSGMVNALGVPRNLLTNHSCRVGMLFRAANPANVTAFKDLNVERANARAIMRAGAANPLHPGGALDPRARSSRGRGPSLT